MFKKGDLVTYHGTGYPELRFGRLTVVSEPIWGLVDVKVEINGQVQIYKVSTGYLSRWSPVFLNPMGAHLLDDFSVDNGLPQRPAGRLSVEVPNKRPFCECGGEHVGGSHSSWCPKF